MDTCSATSVLKLMPSTQEQITIFADQVKNDILWGEFNFKDFLYQKRFIEKTLEAIYEDPKIKEYIHDEMEKEYGSVTFNDVTFKLESRKTWDYSKTEDEELFKMLEQKELLDAKIKERQKFLQAMKKEIADTETGAIIYPPAYREKTFITTSRKR